MVAIKNIILLATSAAAAVLPRDASTVLTDLQKIDTDTKDLSSSIGSWDGSVLGALTIQNKASGVGTDTDNANKDAQGVTASSDDSKKIVDFINSSLEPDIKASLDALVARKADFDKDGLTSTVKSTVSDLKSKAGTLSTTLVSGASDDQKSAGQAAADKISGDFDSAISALG